MAPTRQSPRKHVRLPLQVPASGESRMNQAIAETRGKPRHCRRCPGRPLLTECVHSARNRSASRNDLDAQVVEQANETSPQTITDDADENPFLSQSVPTAPTLQQPRTPVRPRHELRTFVPIIPSASIISRGSVEPPGSPSPVGQSTGGTGRSDMMLRPDIASPATSSTASPGDSTPMTTPSSNTSSKRVRAKKSDPIFGFVQGCHRGGGKVNIFRKHQLRPVQTQQALATARYHEGVQDILGRAERVAVESSSWVMVLAQHPNAHKGCYYFLSPRMYKDSAAEKALQLAQSFSDLTSSLIQARRKDAAALAADNETLKRSLNEANAKEAALLQKIKELESRGEHSM